MKTEEEIKETMTEGKKELLEHLSHLKLAIEADDWEEVMEFAQAFNVGACLIYACQGILINPRLII